MLRVPQRLERERLLQVVAEPLGRAAGDRPGDQADQPDQHRAAGQREQGDVHDRRRLVADVVMVPVGVAVRRRGRDRRGPMRAAMPASAASGSSGLGSFSGPKNVMKNARPV